MVDRVKGTVQEGLWFSADAIFATLTVTGATYLADLALSGAAAVGSDLEQTIEILEQRGTVLGFFVDAETVVQVILDYGQALGSSGTTLGNQVANDVLTALEADIDAIAGLSAAAFTNVGTAFAATT